MPVACYVSCPVSSQTNCSNVSPLYIQFDQAGGLLLQLLMVRFKQLSEVVDVSVQVSLAECAHCTACT